MSEGILIINIVGPILYFLATRLKYGKKGDYIFLLLSSIFPISSNLWIVFASSPVDSDIFFAALPVGAHRTTLYPFM